MRPKVLRHVARRAREVGHGRAPLVRVDALGAVEHVARDPACVPRPEPDLDTGVRTFHREEAAAVRVEVDPERVGRPVEHAAARVARRGDVAVRADGRARHRARAADRATWGGRGERE